MDVKATGMQNLRKGEMEEVQSIIESNYQAKEEIHNRSMYEVCLN